jgi:Spy/CpxP family protein refolding chaperone
LFRPTSFGGGATARRLSALGLVWITLGCGVAIAQQGGPPPQNGPGDNMGPPPMEGRRPPMERAFHMGPHGRWWNNPEFAQKLGLTADQQKRMEAVFQQARPNLMDLSANVRSQETAMEPLLGVDQPDEGKILAQIDHVAQARAELEKANARMLLGLRRVLTPDQWKTLQADEPKGDPRGHYPHFGPRGDPGPNPGPTP